jgi:alkylhydroperoxidase family enzyme
MGGSSCLLTVAMYGHKTVCKQGRDDVSYFRYDNSTYAIREDISAAHAQFWQNLSSPGNWWTGAERVAIANEVRNALSCDFCANRKQALSPYSFAGEHRHSDSLSKVAIDAVHRVITDQTRITKAWVDGNVAKGLSKGAYVELAGLAVAMLSIDEFHRALGLSLEELPAPVAGEPDGYMPALAQEGTGFVPMLPDNGAVGDEADLWGDKSANVVRAFSAVPNAVRDWIMISNAQYLSFEGMMNFDSPENRAINRMQIELIAGRVSAINECFY